MKITQDAIINVSHEVTKADGTNDGIWFFGNRLNIEDELIIGFSPTNYHCFIICGDYEFHPRFSINNCKLGPSRKNNIRAAFFIRIKNIPKNDILKFQIYMEDIKGKRTPTCHTGLLQILDRGIGLKIPQHSIFKTTPKSFLTGVMERGIVDINKNSLELEVYSIRNKPLDMIYKDIALVNLKFGWIFKLSNMYFRILRLFRPEILVR
ncbi:MAG: hypothetical protein H7177_06025 [Rhizobacter sp.]|nr:hypothetical protein [Bacteriovorax sp.]